MLNAEIPLFKVNSLTVKVINTSYDKRGESRLLTSSQHVLLLYLSHYLKYGSDQGMEYDKISKSSRNDFEVVSKPR